MALSLRDVQRDPIANRALNELMHIYCGRRKKPVGSDQNGWGKADAVRTSEPSTVAIFEPCQPLPKPPKVASGFPKSLGPAKPPIPPFNFPSDWFYVGFNC
jgi:hypothetical protein